MDGRPKLNVLYSMLRRSSHAWELRNQNQPTNALQKRLKQPKEILFHAKLQENDDDPYIIRHRTNVIQSHLQRDKFMNSKPDNFRDVSYRFDKRINGSLDMMIKKQEDLLVSIGVVEAAKHLGLPQNVEQLEELEDDITKEVLHYLS